MRFLGGTYLFFLIDFFLISCVGLLKIMQNAACSDYVEYFEGGDDARNS